jgi:hypothetical protein
MSSGSRLRSLASFVGRVVRMTAISLADQFPVLLAWWIVLLAIQAVRDRAQLPGATPTAQATSILWFAVITGLCSMALLETAKRLASLRGFYQERQISAWFRSRASRMILEQDPFVQLLRAMGAQDRGVRLGDSYILENRYRHRLFNLPIEQLVAQIRLAADVAIVNPQQHRALLVALAGSESLWLDVEDNSVQQLELAHQVRAGIDALQISIGESWRRYVRALAVSISGLVGLLLASFAGIEGRAGEIYVLASLVLGGFFAWLARDLTAAVERWRR